MVGAVAIRGEGVLETLYAVLQLRVPEDGRAGGAEPKNIGLTEEEFLSSDLRATWT